MLLKQQLNAVKSHMELQTVVTQMMNTKYMEVNKSTTTKKYQRIHPYLLFNKAKSGQEKNRNQQISVHCNTSPHHFKCSSYLKWFGEVFDSVTLLLLLRALRLCTWRSRLCEKAESNTCRDDRRPGLLRTEQVSAGLSRDLHSARCGSNRQQPCVTASEWAVITAVQEAKMFSCRDETRRAHTNTFTRQCPCKPPFHNW